MLKVTGLTRSFGTRKVLDDVSLTIREGEMVALLGASGSGKSTLLRHISGLMVGGAQEGRIDFEGAPFLVDGKLMGKSRRVRARISMIFQQFNLVDRLQVRTNVALGALARVPLWRSLIGWFPKDVNLLVMESLDRVGIGAKAYDRASTLSGGQQQRAAIARALTQKAALILADEPIASLDPESSKRVMETLSDVNTTEGVTVIVCLHQVDFAVRYCPRTIALKDGRVVFDGPSKQLSVEFLQSVYGSATQELISNSLVSANEASAPAVTEEHPIVFFPPSSQPVSETKAHA